MGYGAVEGKGWLARTELLVGLMVGLMAHGPKNGCAAANASIRSVRPLGMAWMGSVSQNSCLSAAPARWESPGSCWRDLLLSGMEGASRSLPGLKR